MSFCLMFGSCNREWSGAYAQVGKHAVGFGTGHFNGEDAVSLGYTGSLMTDSNNVISIKVGAAFSKGGNNTFGMGASYNFN